MNIYSRNTKANTKMCIQLTNFNELQIFQLAVWTHLPVSFNTCRPSTPHLYVSLYCFIYIFVCIVFISISAFTICIYISKFALSNPPKVLCMGQSDPSPFGNAGINSESAWLWSVEPPVLESPQEPASWFSSLLGACKNTYFATSFELLGLMAFPSE